MGWFAWVYELKSCSMLDMLNDNPDLLTVPAVAPLSWLDPSDVYDLIRKRRTPVLPPHSIEPERSGRNFGACRKQRAPLPHYPPHSMHATRHGTGREYAA